MRKSVVADVYLDFMAPTLRLGVVFGQCGFGQSRELSLSRAAAGRPYEPVRLTIPAFRRHPLRASVAKRCKRTTDVPLICGENQESHFELAEARTVCISWTMKTLAVRCVIALVILVAASFAFANPFKSRIMTGTSSPLVITVPDDHFLKITNFSQQGGTDRAVVAVTLQGDTENGGTTNVLTATRIDLSTGANSQNSPEIINRAIIAGPAQVTVAPVTGATLFISYRKESNEGGGGGGGGNVVVVTPTPASTGTPGISPFPSITPLPTSTP
jgi:hypothetical protein